MSLKPSTPKKSIPYSVILPNARLDSDKITVLNSLRSNYRGVRDIARFYLRENNGESIPCIRIDMQSEDLAKTLINNANMVIDGRIYSIETSPRSLIVMKVPTNQTIHNLSSDLSHNYTSIESISRFYDHKNDPVDCIRINFKSDANVVQILKDKYIFINGTKAPIQPFRSLVYIKDAPVEQITETPKQTNPTNRRRPAVLTEERVQQLFNEHQQRLQTMMEQFETKWDQRLSSLNYSSNNAAINQLLPIIQDLSNVCQTFSQHNTLVQRQLNVVNRQLQNVQLTSNNQHEIRNGH